MVKGKFITPYHIISSNQIYTEQLCHYLELFHEVKEVSFLFPSAITASVTEN